MLLYSNIAKAFCETSADLPVGGEWWRWCIVTPSRFSRTSILRHSHTRPPEIESQIVRATSIFDYNILVVFLIHFYFLFFSVPSKQRWSFSEIALENRLVRRSQRICKIVRAFRKSENKWVLNAYVSEIGFLFIVFMGHKRWLHRRPTETQKKKKTFKFNESSAAHLTFVRIVGSMFAPLSGGDKQFKLGWLPATSGSCFACTFEANNSILRSFDEMHLWVSGWLSMCATYQFIRNEMNVEPCADDPSICQLAFNRGYWLNFHLCIAWSVAIKWPFVSIYIRIPQSYRGRTAIR